MIPLQLRINVTAPMLRLFCSCSFYNRGCVNNHSMTTKFMPSLTALQAPAPLLHIRTASRVAFRAISSMARLHPCHADPLLSRRLSTAQRSTRGVAPRSNAARWRMRR